MLRVGLTGGLASGKSFVGSELVALGCKLVQADELGHAVLAPGAEAYDEVIAEFGRAILNEDGTINRRRLGVEVFGHQERLTRLNALVHPAVFARQDAIIRQYVAEDPHAIVLIEAAIMIEAGSHKRCDRLIVVVCTEEQQIERSMKRDGLTREAVEARLRHQMPLSEKRKYADYVIDTSQSKELTRAQVRTVYESLRSVNA